MAGFSLVPVDGVPGPEPVPEPVPVLLPRGETLLGRGPLLGISDTRVSRRHGLLQNRDGQLRLQPTHTNPCFLLTPDGDPRPLQRGCWRRLRPGDRFSLLPGRFIYRVEEVGGASAPRNGQKTEDGDEDPPAPDGDRPGSTGGGSRQEADGVLRPEAPPPRRRVLPAWMMAAAATAALAPPRVQAGVKRKKHEAPPSATQAPPTMPSLPVGVELREEEEEQQRPRKKSREEEEKDVVPGERTSSRPGVGPSLDLDEEGGGGGGTSQASEARQSLQGEVSRVRTSCPYGKDCYRKNPVHFQECSHPGDADYQEEEEEEEERPECPYGADCYRKNLQHRKEFRHPQRPVRSTRTDATDADDDSFIDDGSDDAGGDSDYAPPGSGGSEEDDVRTLREEARAFLRKRR